MKIPIILVAVPPGNWAAEHSARGNCLEIAGNTGAILRHVGYVYALFRAASYWIFVKFESSFNKIIPASASQPGCSLFLLFRS